ncbi:MAG: hypothetical protein EBR86_09575, partial [Planctomycetia bacterium]|nr:hypothetical protein [Planctomycetia bacterium]
PTHLRSHGHDVIEPALDHDDFERAMATAQAAFDDHRPDVVVGSSRGGALAMNLRNDSAQPPTPVIRCGGGGVPGRHRRAAFRFPPPATSTTFRRWEEVRVGH